MSSVRRQVAEGTRTVTPLYRPLPWVVVRTPLLPLRGALAPASPDDALADPRVRQALAVGSPRLLAALENADASRKDAQRARRKLDRYLIRMSSRPTPYGTFAGVSLATWGPTTTLALDELGDRTRTRPDMGWLMGLVGELESRPTVLDQCRVRSHPAALVTAGRVQLRDPTSSQFVSVRATPPVLAALARARTPVDLADLRRGLLDQTAGSVDQVDALLAELLRCRLLLTDLRPALTSSSPAHRLLGIAGQRSSCTRVASKLGRLLESMAEHDRGGPDQAVHMLRRIDRCAAELHDGGDDPSYQVDLSRPLAGSSIAETVSQEAAKAAELLLAMSPRPMGPPELDAYRRTFIARYGHHRQVPLLEMLDPEIGIGPMGHGHAVGLSAATSATRAATLQELAMGALRDRQLVVELDRDTVEKLRTGAPTAATAPVSLELSVFLATSDPRALDRGDFLVVVGPNVGSSAAGKSLARFIDLLGDAAAVAMSQATEAEHEVLGQDLARAEVVYQPANSRSGNVVVRTAVQPFEIIVDTEPGVAEDKVIRLDDVSVLVDDNGFCLRSNALDADILPSARHMLNMHQAPSSCRFLDAVAQQDRTQLIGFDWGPAAAFPFLPRVQCGRVVLAPAQWRLPAAGKRSRRSSTEADVFTEELARWRATWSVPAQVYLTMADNRLLLDLDRPEHVDQLRTELGQLGEDGFLLLQEALPGPDQAWVPGIGGSYMSELVIPLVLSASGGGTSIDVDVPGEPPAEPRTQPTRPDLPSTLRVRPPGSEWLYLKLYCPRHLQDELLAGPVTTLCEMAEASGLVEEWFFLRYADPDPHVRLRWRGDPPVLLRHLMPHACDWAAGLVRDGLVSRIGFDTYDRELERYGGPASMRVSERLWWADSRAVLQLLSRTDQVGDITELAALTSDDLLASLGVEESRRLEWYSSQVSRSRTGGTEFRIRQQRLRQVLGAGHCSPDALGSDVVRDVLAQRRATVRPLGADLLALADSGLIATTLSSLWGSYIHLHLNRLLGGRGIGESALLELLQRTRTSLDRAPLRPDRSQRSVPSRLDRSDDEV